MEPVKIDLDKLSEIWPPFQFNIWVKCDTPIQREEIYNALRDNNLQNPNLKVDYELIWDISSREVHVARIAWMVRYWSDHFPIDIDFGVPHFMSGTLEISDGNHRLLAAYYLNKPYIMAQCSGSISEIEKYAYHGHNSKISS